MLNRTVGGTTVHADMKYPRFNEVDFRIASALRDAGRTFDGTSFIDWPLTYDELEPFYTEAETITGVSGVAEGPGSDPFASRRSRPVSDAAASPRCTSAGCSPRRRATPATIRSAIRRRSTRGPIPPRRRCSARRA